MGPKSTSPAPAANEGHQVAGRYVLRRLVASGGMAQVWEALDTVLGRPVAVKLLHPHLAGDPQFVDRFRDEARAAARLSHQSIVAIYDTATDDGIEAIVMELIDGITLRQYLDGHGRLSLDDAADLTTQVAAALDTAHRARIVHRDIKPGNIMLCPDRRVKVTDFGIAKALEAGDRTTQGTLLGTAKYLAPEQVEGLPVDARADVYSLGVVLYEALTGSPPFQAESDSATALARLHTEPRPLREIDHTIPPAVEAVVLRALARDRNGRFDSAGAMAAALTSALAEPVVLVDGTAADTTVAALDPTMTRPDAAGPRTGTTTDASASPTLVDVDGSDPSPGVEIMEEPAAPRVRLRPSLGSIVVTLVIVGCLALGVGLILATGSGRDFFERISDNGDNGDTAVPAEADTTTPVISSTDTSPDAEAESDAADAPVPTDGVDADATPSGAGTIAVMAVTDFDPLGDGVERSERTGRAIDGDPTTKWTSERYSNRAMGNLKEGVGLVLTLDGEHTLDTLAVTSPTQGWAARVYLADAPAADLDGWGEPIDARVGIPGDTSFDLRGVRASAVLIWITDLGDAPPRLRIEIAELGLS